MNKPIDYKQYDARWAGNDYSAKGEKKTIKSSGCGVTCAAMVIATLKNNGITPADTARYSLKHGYKALNQGTYYTYFVSQFKEYGIKCMMLNNDSCYHNSKHSAHKRALKALEKGNMVIAVMGAGLWTSGGHYVLAYGVSNNKVYINDCASASQDRHCNTVKRWQNEVKHYWIIEVPNVTVTTKCRLYKKDDTIHGSYEVQKKGDVDIFIKDCGNGWSIVRHDNNTGYLKNTCLNKKGLSSYDKCIVTKKAAIRKKNSVKSGKYGTAAVGAEFRVVYRGKNWHQIKYKYKGKMIDAYISAKKVKILSK